MVTPTDQTASKLNDDDNIDIESGDSSGCSGTTAAITLTTTNSSGAVAQPLQHANEQTSLLGSLPVDTSVNDTTPTQDDALKPSIEEGDIGENGAEATVTAAASVSTEVIPASSIRQTAMSGFAGLGFVTSLISMMAEYSATAIQHPAIVISGVLGLILSPYAKFQQEKLTQVKALEQTNTVLEDELKYLQQQHQEITKHVEHVNTSTTKLHTLQVALTTIQSTNVQSIDHLEQQVQESKQVLLQLRQNKQAMILQNLITVLVNCDRDHTMTLSDDEVDMLIKSLESIHNVKFNDTKLRQRIIQHNRSITSIMEIARNVILKDSSTATTTTNTIDVGNETRLPIQTGTVIENESIFSYIES